MILFILCAAAVATGVLFSGFDFIGDITNGVLNADAIKAAADKNAAALRDINSEQIDYARQSRGKDGLPTWLPLYTGDYESGTLFPQAQNTYNAAMNYLGSPSDAIKFNQGVLNSWNKAIDNSGQIVKSLFSGQHTSDELANQQAVNQARLAAAGSVRTATNLNIQDRLNQMKAQQANRGFVGGSTFDQSAMLRDVAPMYNQAAGAETSARLQNATDDAAIKQNNWLMAIQNPTLPNQMAATDMSTESLPALQAIQDRLTAAGIFAPFNLGQWTPPTLKSPIPEQANTAWGTAASAAGDDLNTWLNNLWTANQNDKAATAAKSEAQAQRDWLTGLFAGNNAGSTGTGNPGGLSDADYGAWYGALGGT